MERYNIYQKKPLRERKAKPQKWKKFWSSDIQERTYSENVKLFCE